MFYACDEVLCPVLDIAAYALEVVHWRHFNQSALWMYSGLSLAILSWNIICTVSAITAGFVAFGLCPPCAVVHPRCTLQLQSDGGELSGMYSYSSNAGDCPSKACRLAFDPLDISH